MASVTRQPYLASLSLAVDWRELSQPKSELTPPTLSAKVAWQRRAISSLREDEADAKRAELAKVAEMKKQQEAAAAAPAPKQKKPPSKSTIAPGT
ncbi:hypothetical protein IVA98_05580 [Bradyrhizobium sp. 160]|uniref:hypothetical protein n=1 Tax=Bradyrhizobium sp. 160 TaxID=2782634 RepID=UPI001FFA7866|nr:hypothetical protein [Bradyrhizobium sp. 160]MCK1622724.1 hypothetical protein [Bradyrhizobium sp. 160]